MIQQRIGVNKRDIDKLVSDLKELGTMATNDLRNNVKRGILPIGKTVASKVPTESPFRGMRQNYYGQVQWQQPKPSVAFTPGKRGRNDWTPLVTLTLTGKPKLGFDYTENAGNRRRAPKARSKTYQRRIDSKERSHANTSQGDALIEKARQLSRFNFKAGHFAYGYFLKERPQMIELAIKSLEETARKWNSKVAD
jgi:hypothetical protein